MYDPASHALRTPDRPAVIMGGSGQRQTFAELDERSARLAQLFWAEGLRPGDHVAILMENHIRYFEVFWAAFRSGLYLTAINRYLTPAEAGYIVDNCDAKVLVMSAYKADVAEAIVPITPKVRRRLMVDGTVPGYDAYEEAIMAHPADKLAEEPLGRTMLYSSGTTGQPKGVWRPLTGRTVQEGKPSLVPVYQTLYGMGPDTVYLSPAPIYHSAPLLFSTDSMALGATVVMMEKFDAEQTLALIEKYRVTHAQFVATMFSRMLKLPKEIREKYDLSSLECVITGAAPCSVQVKEAMIDWFGPIINEYYSGTEDTGATVINSEEALAHPGSVGRAALESTIHICGPDGEELPTGEVGRIYFETSDAVAGFKYYGEPEKTAGAHHPDHPNWTALGDLGRLDDQGYLYLSDRESFMIVAGGVNIYPQEIENALLLHPAVQDAAVFGVPNEDLGEEVKAVVQLVDSSDAGDEMVADLLAHCAGHLARFKIPRSIDFQEDFPRLPTGKLYKGPLREKYWSGHASRLL
ncbi:acyl-CoA synthetase [Prescottella equi]|uniref:acyl-CoA synthetase n=1 Tax=Rhodococcus hoagii TaxID=43767 RepID=UPI00301D438A